MWSGRCWSRCCQRIRLAVVGGGITARWCRASCFGSVLASRGGTYRSGSAPGRRCTNANVGGRWTVPGGGSARFCVSTAMSKKARTGPSVWIRPPCGRISTQLAPGMRRRPTIRKGEAARDEKGGREALGRSRGGLTTKPHLAADRRCRPITRHTTPGQRADCTGFEQVMAGIPIPRPVGRPRTRPGHVLADKAHSSKAIRTHLRRWGITATIPIKADQAANRRTKGSRGGRPLTFDAEPVQATQHRRCCHHQDLATRPRPRPFAGTAPATIHPTDRRSRAASVDPRRAPRDRGTRTASSSSTRLAVVPMPCRIAPR